MITIFSLWYCKLESKMSNETGWSQLTGSPDKRTCQPQQLITLQLIGARPSFYSADNEETVYLYMIPAEIIIRPAVL